MAGEEVLDEDALQQIYTWIDEVPLSRPKKNIARDFSDGGMKSIHCLIVLIEMCFML